MPVNVLFVCLGNICRSPTAHGVFQALVDQQNLAEHIRVDSAGTGGWHIGEEPDGRSQSAALERGYDLSSLKARKVTRPDFEEFDFILAMDYSNLQDLQSMRPENFEGELRLFLSYAEGEEEEVPDPYYGGAGGFDHVLDLVESASQGLLKTIVQRHGLGS